MIKNLVTYPSHANKLFLKNKKVLNIWHDKAIKLWVQMPLWVPFVKVRTMNEKNYTFKDSTVMLEKTLFRTISFMFLI